MGQPVVWPGAKVVEALWSRRGFKEAERGGAARGEDCWAAAKPAWQRSAAGHATRARRRTRPGHDRRGALETGSMARRIDRQALHHRQSADDHLKLSRNQGLHSPAEAARPPWNGPKKKKTLRAAAPAFGPGDWDRPGEKVKVVSS